jgi:hypothetical protein
MADRLAWPAEFPALIDEVAQRLFVREDEDQAILVHAEAQPALHLHHLHERLPMRAIVDDHASPRRTTGEEELDAEGAEYGIARRAVDDLACSGRDFMQRGQCVLRHLPHLMPRLNDLALVRRAFGQHLLHVLQRIPSELLSRDRRRSEAHGHGIHHDERLHIDPW